MEAMVLQTHLFLPQNVYWKLNVVPYNAQYVFLLNIPLIGQRLLHVLKNIERLVSIKKKKIDLKQNKNITYFTEIF